MIHIARTTATSSDQRELPFTRRIFLDSGVVQLYFDYGECIFNGGRISATDRIHDIPEGLEDIDGLTLLYLVNRRNAFELAVSENSIAETQARRNPAHTTWLFELVHYWRETLAAYQDEPFTGRGRASAAKLSGKGFGYLGDGDKKLLQDACLLECDGFLTTDRRLAHNAQHLERELAVHALTPTDLQRLLVPWAALF